MADKKNRVPVREQAPEVRAKNFEEVCLGYNKEEAMEEASRCLNCKNARCITGCPVNINIPAFIAEVKEGNFEKASQVIGESSALPAVCGRVCPQESQCEGKCILGIKGEPVSIGKLERFTADWARENNIAPIPAKEKKGKKVAVIGSGPAGLTCAGDLAKMGYDVKIFEALHLLVELVILDAAVLVLSDRVPTPGKLSAPALPHIRQDLDRHLYSQHTGSSHGTPKNRCQEPPERRVKGQKPRQPFFSGKSC